jgi:hypothetical protein
MVRKRGFLRRIDSKSGPIRTIGGQTMRTFDFCLPTSYDHLRRIETSNSIFLTLSLEAHSFRRATGELTWN